IAQLVEHDLAKVGVASSSLVSRSRFTKPRSRGFAFSGTGSRAPHGSPHVARVRAMWKNPGRETVIRPGGRVVMQRTANPRTPVQSRPRPPDRKAPPRRGFFVGRVPIGAEAPPAAAKRFCRSGPCPRLLSPGKNHRGQGPLLQKPAALAGRGQGPLLQRGTHRVSFGDRPGGETGRRKGLKIPHPKGYVGSIPTPGTSARSHRVPL